MQTTASDKDYDGLVPKIPLNAASGDHDARALLAFLLTDRCLPYFTESWVT